MSISHMHAEGSAPLTTTVASRVRGLIAESGMRQQELGPILGISGSAVSKRLRGQMPFGLDELPLVAEAFNVSLSYLLGLTDERTPRRKTAPGGGSFFVLPERSSGTLRACRDSNPKPSDLYLAGRRFAGRLGGVVFERIALVWTSVRRGRRSRDAVVIPFPVDRIPIGEREAS